MDIHEARSWLDSHIDLEKTARDRVAAPTLDRVQELVEALGHPERDFPVLHITGTNGKGSVARMATSLLGSAGVTCGTYTSPHLHEVNERIRRNGHPIEDSGLAEALSIVALAAGTTGVTPTWFEILTAAAFRHFSDEGVACAVVEVGMAGRWDATNVVDAAVAAVTSVEVDHVEYLGDDPVGIAEEKAGIVKPGCTLVLGEERPDRAAPFLSAGAARVLHRGPDFGCDADLVAVGGRMVTLRTPEATYADLFLPVLGAHQADNAAVALTSVEVLLGAPLAPEVVEIGFGSLELPGRCEIAARHPMVVLDGAHNGSGARALASTLAFDLAGIGPRVFVVGLLARDPEWFLDGLGLDAAEGDRLIACPIDSPRSVDPASIVAAAESVGVAADPEPDLGVALASARDMVGSGGLVVVTGSLRLVGAARDLLHLPPT